MFVELACCEAANKLALILGLLRRVPINIGLNKANKKRPSVSRLKMLRVV